MKTKILMMTAIACLASSKAMAHATCAGETYTGTIVEVFVQTLGTMGFPSSGEVRITPKEGAPTSYPIKREEISQFFENDEDTRAVVGLAAYSDYNNPIFIRYVGSNFQSDDLTGILRTPGRVKEAGNEMRVWMGPGYPGGEQYSFKDVVCYVVLDP